MKIVVGCFALAGFFGAALILIPDDLSSTNPVWLRTELLTLVIMLTTWAGMRLAFYLDDHLPQKKRMNSQVATQTIKPRTERKPPMASNQSD